MSAPGTASETVLAIDPGRAKCGLAVVVGTPPSCLHRGVVETDRLLVEAAGLLRRFPQIVLLLIGSGTGSAPLRRALADTFPRLPLQIIDEHGSSARARQRFLTENRPAGWRRLVPSSWRVPDRPYDDYVALLLAEDYFSKKTDIKGQNR